MPTLNQRAWQLCDAMAAEAEKLGIALSTLECGTRVIDCGVRVDGSIEAGRRLAEVCMAGLGEVEIVRSEEDGPAEFEVLVTTREPVAACMASQYAGWEIKGESFFAMGSGPMRAAAGREELFQSIGHRENADRCVGILETSKLPPESVCVDIAAKCGVPPERLTLLTARTASLTGTLQIVARSVETTLHKLHVLGFDLKRIARGAGAAPLPPVADDDLKAIGWTNDAILYGANVTLAMHGGVDDLKAVGRKVPSCASADYGRPFSEIFARYNHDFYRIDPLLFSPATVMFMDFNNPESTGLAFGRLAPEVLTESFGRR